MFFTTCFSTTCFSSFSTTCFSSLVKFDQVCQHVLSKFYNHGSQRKQACSRLYACSRTNACSREHMPVIEHDMPVLEQKKTE